MVYLVQVKRPLKTLTSLTKRFIGTNVNSIFQPNNQLLIVNKFAWIFSRSNVLRIVNMVFEVDKYHNWSNTLTWRVRANTLFLRQIQTKYKLEFWKL